MTRWNPTTHKESIVRKKERNVITVQNEKIILKETRKKSVDTRFSVHSKLYFFKRLGGRALACTCFDIINV